jgi:hypothetical protein
MVEIQETKGAQRGKGVMQVRSSDGPVSRR